MAKKILTNLDLLALPSLTTPASGSVGFGAKSDGLYQKIGSSEEKLLTTNESSYIPLVIGTQTATTASWTGVLDVDSLESGQTIRYWLPRTSASGVTLNLTLKGGGTTGAINCYVRGTSRLTTHYPAGSYINMTYLEGALINGTAYTGWWAQTYYADGTESYTVRWNAAIKVGAQITQYKLLVQGSDGRYYPTTVGNTTAGTKTISTVPFLIGSPIIFYSRTTTVAAGGVTSSSYNYTGITTSNTTYTWNQNSGWRANEDVYLKGTVSGALFTLDNTTLTSHMTQDLPTSEDGFYYMRLGVFTNTTTGFRLSLQHPVYYFADGELQSLNTSNGADWNDIIDKPLTFTPSSHKHPTTDITGLGNIATINKNNSTANYLRGDGTWVTPPNTKYSVATTSASGLMSSTDKSKLDGIVAGANKYSLPTASITVLGGIKVGGRLSINSGTLSANVQSDNNFTDTYKTKLDGIASNANNYSHPTTAGNKHIPSGGATNQILRYSTNGTAVWSAEKNTTYGAVTTSANGLMIAADKEKLNGIAEGANKYSHPSTHPYSMITGVPTKLSEFTNDLGNYGSWITKAQGDGYYAPKSHTHSYLPLAGGKLTGDLEIFAGNTDKFIKFAYDTTDAYAWRIGYLGTGSGNENRLTFQSAKTSGASYVDALSFGLDDLVGKFAVTPTVGNTKVSLEGHTHSNFTRTVSGFVPAPGLTTTTRYLREDGTWVIPPNTNTTYSAMTVAEGTTGTATSSRTMRADYLKQIIQHYNTTYSTGTLVQLKAGTDTTGRLQTAKNLNDWLNPKLNDKFDKTGGRLTTGTGDVNIELWRGTNASWNISNSGGYLRFQSNYTTVVGAYFDALKLNYNTGNALFKGNVTAPSFIGALSGNASTATTLASSRSISMTGDVNWSVNFNGGANVTAAGTIQSNAVTTAKILDNNVTFAKIQNIATTSILGRSRAGTGNIEALTTIPSAVLGNSSLYIGTTRVALNRSSGAMSLNLGSGDFSARVVGADFVEAEYLYIDGDGDIFGALNVYGALNAYTSVNTPKVIFNAAGWSMEQVGTELQMKHNGNIRMRFLSDGSIVAAGEVTAITE